LSCERYTLIRPVEETSVISSSEIVQKAAGPATVAYAFIKLSASAGFHDAFEENFIIALFFVFCR